MGEEIADYVGVILKKQRFIISTTLIAMLLIGTISFFIFPKTYECEATIQLGTIDGILALEPENAREICQSSVILDPVIKKIYIEEDKMMFKTFSEDYVSCSTIKEDLSYNQKKTLPFINIKTKAKTPEKSVEIAREVIDNFITYVNVDFNEKKNLLVEELDESNNLASEEYKTSNELSIKKYEKILENIKSEIGERKDNIKGIQNDITNLESEILPLDFISLSTEEMSKTILLKSILDNTKDRLLSEKGYILDLETELIQTQLNLENELVSNNRTLQNKLLKNRIYSEKKLTNTEGFKVIKEPKTPLDYTSFKPLTHAVLAFVVVFPLTILFILFKKKINVK